MRFLISPVTIRRAVTVLMADGLKVGFGIQTERVFIYTGLEYFREEGENRNRSKVFRK